MDADSAYFDDAGMEKAADARYQWFTFNSPERRSRSTLKGHVIDHAMVKWDAVGRDRPRELPRQTDLIIKDASVLSRVLDETRDSELLVIATWNDLGEGTGHQPQLRLLLSWAVAAPRLLHAAHPEVAGRTMKVERWLAGQRSRSRPGSRSRPPAPVAGTPGRSSSPPRSRRPCRGPMERCRCSTPDGGLVAAERARLSADRDGDAGSRLGSDRLHPSGRHRALAVLARDVRGRSHRAELRGRRGGVVLVRRRDLRLLPGDGRRVVVPRAPRTLQSPHGASPRIRSPTDRAATASRTAGPCTSAAGASTTTAQAWRTPSPRSCLALRTMPAPTIFAPRRPPRARRWIRRASRSLNPSDGMPYARAGAAPVLGRQ